MVHPAAASDSATQYIPATGRDGNADAYGHPAGEAGTSPSHTGDPAPAGATGREVARAAIMAAAGLALMLPAIAVMPKFGQWMADHGPFAVMLPFMLWMMLAGGLLSSGAMKILAAARS